jgi:hypothetical protein
MLKNATFAAKSKYCDSIDKSGRVIYDAEKYLFNNPAYMTHNFQKKQLFPHYMNYLILMCKTQLYNLECTPLKVLNSMVKM